ncbi:MAG TPA: ABC transporter ATP-binding protein [Gemmatimonadota bacterium]|jgi:ABC-2 type transport system ATP-binding protein|nr:ABC transporter ATP-binding protein [Gemmatimonadota bacterium]
MQGVESELSRSGVEVSAIACTGLSRVFGRHVALDGIALDVRPGELYGFLGPNGAGKTTTIRILTGLLLPSGGTAHVAGFDVVRDPFEVKRRIGYVPDRVFLYEKLTGAEFLEFVGDLYGLGRGRVRGAAQPYIERFGLGAWIHELIEAYSHGMRQKLALAAALLHEPEVLILDEPMVGLDPRSARDVKGLLQEFAAAGRTVFLSTHTLEVAETLCTRVAIIQAGRILTQGTLDDLRREARHDGGSLEAVFLRLTDPLAGIERAALA